MIAYMMFFIVVVLVASGVGLRESLIKRDDTGIALAISGLILGTFFAFMLLTAVAP